MIETHLGQSLPAGVSTPGLWLTFAGLVSIVLGVDLGIVQRRKQGSQVAQAGAFTLFVLAMTLAFNAFLAWKFGREVALQFFTGYLVEEALSVDNLFVFLVIFRGFAVPPALQPRVLFWGIFGALILRGLFIGAGVALINSFSWIFYVFGAFLLVTGAKLWRNDDSAAAAPDNNAFMRLYRRLIPSTEQLHGNRFFIKENGRRLATPLFLVLCVVEASDIVFAFDSIPAIFSVTTDVFLVYTSNICAILGLRSLYFVLATLMQRFVYLRQGLSAVLVFIGLKMLGQRLYHVGSGVSLLVIFTCLGAAILCSLRHKSPTGRP
jgi:tellurite resistance protein TerC